MEILGKILGSPARVKLMRLFLQNRAKVYRTKDIQKHSRVTPNVLSRELRLLSSVGFIKRRGGEWSLNPSFRYANELEELLINTDTLDTDAVLDTLKSSGRVKLIIVSGIFLKNRDTRIDLLVVGDNLKRGRIETGVRKMEAEIGAELTYAIFDTKEFIYRLNMYDKLIRDILDFPHTVLLRSKDLNIEAHPPTA